MKDQPVIRFHSTAIFVKDITVAKQFYIETLHQVIEHDFGKNVILKSGITLWEISNSHIIPRELGPEYVRNERSARFELYFETESLEQISKQLQTRGVQFLHPLHEEPWGQRTIRLFDPDHHLIEIGEPLSVFVKRLNQEGMTPEQVSAKTSVPLKTVRELLEINQDLH
ncbi:MAG TPA: hypothetical protein PLP19_17085 [bacterium]|nr:hypothetical protein [bacterium]HPN45210.1 hypothetical protein [bacterium]